jgi:hypothetical protein
MGLKKPYLLPQSAFAESQLNTIGFVAKVFFMTSLSPSRVLVFFAAIIATAPFVYAADKIAATNLLPAIEPVHQLTVTPDPCLTSDITANPTRPAWDLGAATTQCGVVESDFGFQWQAVGDGTGIQGLPASIRYGLTPKLDLRWGLTTHQWQSGTGDQWVNARFRFHEQGRISPAFAFDYGFKIPTANPAKGFGTGFVDHQFLFLASRDLGHTHLDFNTVGTLAGTEHGHDGAAQFGLALTQTLSKRFAGILESYGGPQPGTSDRYGSVLAGGLFSIRPWLVLDAAYTQAFTAGAPRRQVLFGITYARRAGRPLLHNNFATRAAPGR